jgi:hypothetical protein
MSSLRFLLSFFSASSALLLGVGCGHSSPDGSRTELSSLGPDGPQDGGAAANDADVWTGPHATAVRANGTGCPAGTWDSQIAPDGASITVTLRSYDLSVQRGDAFSIADCTFSVQVGDAAGYAFTLERVTSSGAASADGAGLTAEESVKYYFQGNPLANETHSKQLASGSTDAGTAFENAIDSETTVWSRCGGGRDLNVIDRWTLRNNADKSGAGHVTPTAVKLQLGFRRCGT